MNLPSGCGSGAHTFGNATPSLVLEGQVVAMLGEEVIVGGPGEVILEPFGKEQIEADGPDWDVHPSRGNSTGNPWTHNLSPCGGGQDAGSWLIAREGP
jgi:hypothetical protein